MALIYKDVETVITGRLRSSDNLTYCFGDEREIPEPSREEAVGKYGNTILTVLAVSSGSFMVLYFNS